MQISPLGMGNLSTNTAIAANQETAERANFAQMLKENQDKIARAAEGAKKGVISDAEQAKQNEELRKVCKDFEAMFINMMYREMRNTVPKDKLFGESNAMNIFQDMRDTEMTKSMAQAGGIGIADMLYRQLTLPGVKPARG